ncbi:MAG: hypothetical protein ACE5IQ_14800 [Candidatus Methylomirabilales bacterium]
MVKRILSKGRFWVRRQVRRLQTWLGLPTMSCRATLLVLLALIALAVVSVTLLGDFITKMGQYDPQYYEPKDYQRQIEVERKQGLGMPRGNP